MLKSKPVICLPMRTAHNVRSPIQDYIKNGEFKILLDTDFVDINNLSWVKTIFNKAKRFKGLDVHFVIVGHPLVNFVAIYAISKFAAKLTIYAWDRRNRKYVQIEYPFEEVKA